MKESFNKIINNHNAGKLSIGIATGLAVVALSGCSTQDKTDQAEFRVNCLDPSAEPVVLSVDNNERPIEYSTDNVVVTCLNGNIQTTPVSVEHIKTETGIGNITVEYTYKDGWMQKGAPKISSEISKQKDKPYAGLSFYGDGTITKAQAVYPRAEGFANGLG